MSTEQVRILRDAKLRTGERFRSGEMAVVDASVADYLVSKGCASYTHRVELKIGLLIGSTVHAPGTIVEVSERSAVAHHVQGTGIVLDPSRLGRLPDPDGPKRPDPEPCPHDPRVRVKFKRQTFYHRRSYAIGDVEEVAERYAAEFVATGCASVVKGQEWTSEGARYLRRCEEAEKKGRACLRGEYSPPPAAIVPKSVDPELV